LELHFNSEHDWVKTVIEDSESANSVGATTRFKDGMLISTDGLSGKKKVRKVDAALPETWFSPVADHGALLRSGWYERADGTLVLTAAYTVDCSDPITIQCGGSSNEVRGVVEHIRRSDGVPLHYIDSVDSRVIESANVLEIK
jgi:hypothetical protein